jgi:mRNA-degrading endonuclease toxin of MazEF toxin-antitoxin module
MRRGDTWTVSGDKDYMGKPRPVVIVQDDSFDGTASITICASTTDETDGRGQCSVDFGATLHEYACCAADGLRCDKSLGSGPS